MHIEQYLEAPRDGEAEQDDGPKGELDYWRNRYERLRGFDQGI